MCPRAGGGVRVIRLQQQAPRAYATTELQCEESELCLLLKKTGAMKKKDYYVDVENETHYIGLYAKKAWAEKKAAKRGYNPADVYAVERRG